MYFDAHSDVFTDVTRKSLLGEKDVFRKYHWENYLNSGITGSIFVMWIDNGFTDCPEKRAIQIEQAAKQMFEESDDIVKRVLRYEDFEIAKNENKLGIMPGCEGLSHIGNDLARIESLYQGFGTRHASLTWNEENVLATGAAGDPNRGVTSIGKDAVKLIQELGMLLDVSHLNDKSFWDVIDITKAPIIASHSNSRAVCDHRRNLTDDQIKAIASTGGVMGMNAYHEFISKNDEEKNCKGLADHLERMIDLVGIDHVGCGFDFVDYLANNKKGSTNESKVDQVKDLYTVSQAGNFVLELERRGYKAEDIQKIKYDNFMRVIKQVLK